MKLKFDEQGHAVVVDGKPVYVYDDGKEIPFDAPGTVANITRINGHAKSMREKAEEFEEKLKAYEGLDPSAARKALETIANIDTKKMIDAGEVEKVRAEAAKAFEDQLKAVEAKYAPVLKERDDLSAKLIDRTLGAAFSGSKFIGDSLAIPHDMARAAFGNAFKVEGDQIVAYAQDGNKIFSRERPGEVAGFDEALSLLVERYPFRDQIMKGSGASGSGARGSGGASGMGKSLNRAAFEALPADQQMAHIKAGGKLTD